MRAPDHAATARPVVDRIGHGSDEIGYRRCVFRHVLLAQRGRPASRRARKVHLDSLGRVVVSELLEDGQLGVSDFLVNVPAPLRHELRLVNPKVVGHSHTGDEVHALVVGAVDQHRERVEAPVDEALHVVPHVVVRHLIERLNVGTEPFPLLGRVKKAVPRARPCRRRCPRWFRPRRRWDAMRPPSPSAGRKTNK